jgi:protein involved in polysaccharide export with SLBB domain
MNTNFHRFFVVLPYISALAFTSVICGCSGRTILSDPVVMPEKPVSYLLSPGDSVEVKFAYAPDFNDAQLIRPDGKIAMQLIGDVQAAGRAPQELRDSLQAAFSSVIKSAELTVIVRKYAERHVYISGEVNRPGNVPIRSKLTILEAIMDAGGFTVPTAKLSTVLLIRNENGKWHGYSLNLEDQLHRGEVNQIELQPSDIVYVPRTTITKIDQFVDQYINKVIPIIGPSYTKPVGNGSLTIYPTSR